MRDARARTIDIKSPRGAMQAATLSALAVLILTSVHHAYGAVAFGTPWRYHMVLVAGVTAAVLLASFAFVRTRPSGLASTVAVGLLVLTVLAVPVLLIGAFEGLYNHVLKNALFVGGASASLMAELFPPPTYEMPGDVFFELTGIMQVVPAGFAAWHLSRMLWRRPTGLAPGHSQPRHAE